MYPRQPLDIVTLDIMMRRLGGGSSSCSHLEVDRTVRREEWTSEHSRASEQGEGSGVEHRLSSHDETEGAQKVLKLPVVARKSSSAGNTRCSSPTVRKLSEAVKTIPSRLGGVAFACDSRKNSRSSTS